MRIVAALGGNALLKRGERPDAATQIVHVARAVEALAPLAREHELVVTVEENVLPGGFGSAVLEHLEDAFAERDTRRARVLRIGLPDRYVTHGTPKLLHEEVGFTAECIAERIEAAVMNPHGSLASA